MAQKKSHLCWRGLNSVTVDKDLESGLGSM